MVSDQSGALASGCRHLMTTQGASAALDATQTVDAYRACLLSGRIRSESIHPSNANDDYHENLTYIHSGDWASYKYLSFREDIRAFCATVGSLIGGGAIEVHCDHEKGPLLCACEIPNTGGWKMWQQVEAKLQLPVTGIHAIYLVFRGNRGRLLDLLDFSFNGSNYGTADGNRCRDHARQDTALRP